MNIFVVDEDPVKAAKDLCDKHVVKMIVESAQLLCTAGFKEKPPYKKTHKNHPCAVWCRESQSNYIWLLDHAYALCDEYESRYCKQHKSLEVLRWCEICIDELNFNKHELTPFVQCVPKQYKNESTVAAYRNYYIEEKSRFAKWNYSDKPSWWPKEIS